MKRHAKELQTDRKKLITEMCALIAKIFITGISFIISMSFEFVFEIFEIHSNPRRLQL